MWGRAGHVLLGAVQRVCVAHHPGLSGLRQHLLHHVLPCPALLCAGAKKGGYGNELAHDPEMKEKYCGDRNYGGSNLD